MTFFRLLPLLILVGTSVASAQTRLRQYLVYASEGIRAHSSDYQGRTGSGGPIQLLNFMVNLPRTESGKALLSSSSIDFARGAVRRDLKRPMDAAGLAKVSAPSLRLNLVAHAGAEKKATFSSRSMTDQMTRLAESLRSDLPRYVNPVRVETASFTGAGGLSLNYFEIEGSRLSDAREISFAGNDRELFVVRVTGSSPVRWIGTHFSLSPGMTPNQILFFFDGAPSLTIRESGSDAWTGFGIPANFLAPDTVLIFNSALITGSVWVKRIDSLGMDEALRFPAAPSALPSGQINDGCFPWERLAVVCECSR